MLKKFTIVYNPITLLLLKFPMKQSLRQELMSRQLILLNYSREQGWGSGQSETDNPKVVGMTTESYWD